MSHILVRYEEGNRLEIRKRRKERVKETHEYTVQNGKRLKAVVLNCARLENLNRKKLEIENDEQMSVKTEGRRSTMNRAKRQRMKEEEEEEIEKEEEEEEEEKEYLPSEEEEEWKPERKISTRSRRNEESKKRKKASGRKKEDEEDDEDDDDRNSRRKVRKQDRRLSHYCLFCSKMVKRIRDHHRSAHEDEPEVKEIMATKTKGHKILKWNILVAKGDLEYNKKVLEGQGGALITAKEPQKKDSSRKMVQCDNCWTIIRPRSMACHRKICSTLGKSDEQPPNLLKDITDDGFYEEVVKDMKFGFPDFVLRNKAYYSFGKYLWLEKGFKNAREVQQKLRYLRSLEDEIQDEEDKKKRNLRELLEPGWVDHIIATIKKICGFARTDRKLVIKYPSKILKLTTLVVEVARHERVSALKREEKARAKQIGDFLSVFEDETDKPLRRVARRYIEKMDGKKMEDLPTVEDVWVITRHLEEEATGLLRKLKKSPDEAAWMLLRDNLVVWLGLFNRRRGGASEKLKLADYYRARKVSDEDLERVRNATEEEMDFLKSLRVARIHHKLHEVNLFIPKIFQEAIQTLVAYRWAARIIEENEYVFAAGHESRQPVRATNVFMKYKNLLPSESRDKMTFTNLRKQGATLVRVLDLDNDDLENWALHMGHSRDIQERFYTLKGNPESILKTGKILSLLRNGSLRDNIGKKLDDIKMDLDTSLPTS